MLTIGSADGTGESGVIGTAAADSLASMVGTKSRLAWCIGTVGRVVRKVVPASGTDVGLVAVGHVGIMLPMYRDVKNLRS